MSLLHQSICFGPRLGKQIRPWSRTQPAGFACILRLLCSLGGFPALLQCSKLGWSHCSLCAIEQHRLWGRWVSLKVPSSSETTPVCLSILLVDGMPGLGHYSHVSAGSHLCHFWVLLLNLPGTRAAKFEFAAFYRLDLKNFSFALSGTKPQS